MIASKHFLLLSLLSISLASACQKTAQISTDAVIPLTQVANVGTAPDIAEAATLAATTIEFDAVDFQFGEVAKGDKAVHRYTFKNTGTAPLIIESVKPSCSCTVGDYSKEPVAPGETGFVETSMEAKSVGIFKKSATVTMNTDPRTIVLNFSGEVVE